MFLLPPKILLSQLPNFPSNHSLNRPIKNHTSKDFQILKSSSLNINEKKVPTTLKIIPENKYSFHFTLSKFLDLLLFWAIQRLATNFASILQYMQKVSIIQNAWIAKIAAKKLKASNAAIVIGNTIYLHGVSKDCFLNNQEWLRHELKHVEQYKQLGIVWFVTKYIYQCIRFGYYNSPLEKAARLAECDEQIMGRYIIK